MCTVAELIAKLQTLPQDATVEVGKDDSNYGFTYEPVILDKTETYDFTGVQYKNSSYNSKFVVELKA